MPTSDEPLPEVPDDEIEEISPEFIVSDGVTGEVAAPAPQPQPQRHREPEARRHAPRPEPRERAAPARREPAPVAAPAPAPVGAPAPAADQAAPRAAPQRPGFPLAVALVFLVFGFAGGFFGGRLWERQAAGAGAPPPAAPAATAPAPDPEPAPSREAPKRAARPARPARSAPATGKGRLDLTAPAEAEVYLDGRRIGRGSQRIDVTAGPHRIEVRLGKSRVGERFEVAPNETWTYSVTPSN